MVLDLFILRAEQLERVRNKAWSKVTDAFSFFMLVLVA